MPSPCSTDLRWRIIWLVLGMRKPAREVAELLGVTQERFLIFCVVSVETAMFCHAELVGQMSWHL